MFQGCQTPKGKWPTHLLDSIGHHGTFSTKRGNMVAVNDIEKNGNKLTCVNWSSKTITGCVYLPDLWNQNFFDAQVAASCCALPAQHVVGDALESVFRPSCKANLLIVSPFALSQCVTVCHRLSLGTACFSVGLSDIPRGWWLWRHEVIGFCRRGESQKSAGHHWASQDALAKLEPRDAQRRIF